MSSSLFDSPAASAAPATPATNTFDYHPVPILAPVSLFLGVTSLFAFITVGGLPIALIGLAVSAWCLLQILRSGGVMGGRLFAAGGVILAASSLVGGTATQWILYKNEVPEGYTRLNFSDDIADKGFVIENQYRRPHPDILALDGEKIFLKGYMYPTGKMHGNTAFVFCPDNGQCCFGGTPKLEDMIVVKMKDGKSVDMHYGLIAVAGTFHVRRELGELRFGELTGREPVFEMTATIAEPARTSF